MKTRQRNSSTYYRKIVHRAFWSKRSFLRSNPIRFLCVLYFFLFVHFRTRSFSQHNIPFTNRKNTTANNLRTKHGYLVWSNVVLVVNDKVQMHTFSKHKIKNENKLQLIWIEFNRNWMCFFFFLFALRLRGKETLYLFTRHCGTESKLRKICAACYFLSFFQYHFTVTLWSIRL